MKVLLREKYVGMLTVFEGKRYIYFSENYILSEFQMGIDTYIPTFEVINMTGKFINFITDDYINFGANQKIMLVLLLSTLRLLCPVIQPLPLAIEEKEERRIGGIMNQLFKNFN